MNKLHVLIICLLLPSLAHSAPGVISVSGTVGQDQSITITGSGFGTKAIAGPMLWGDFENGTVGQSIENYAPNVHQGGLSSYSVWDKAGLNDLLISASSPLANSTKHARVAFPTSSVYYTFVAVPYNFSTAGQELYISFDFRYIIESEMPRQMKALIYYDSTSADKLYMSTAFSRCESGGWRSHVTQSGVGDEYLGVAGPAINNEWVRLENHITQGAVSTYNGQWVSNMIRSASIHTQNCVDTRFRTDSNNWTQLAIGGGYYDPCDGDDPGTVDVDNIYIDTTPQRVEIGNAATWAATTRREILIPSAWSDTEITATVRSGFFTGGQTAYLYVIDSNGDANATGYEVTIGESSTPIPINGACGTNHGATLSSLTSGDANNCSAGNVSGFTGTGPWSWTCTGLNGGDNSGACSASLSSGPSGTGMRISVGASTRIGTGSTPITIQ